MRMAAPQEFGVTIEPGTGCVVVRIRGDLDMSNAAVLTEALTEAGAVSGTVIADMADVTFMDSSALSAVVASARALSSSGKRLELGTRSSVVERVLEITGLDRGTDDFDVQPSPEAGSTDG
jgi:anti-sigma B factor antagonist